MMAIIAILSDIPYYVAELVSKITGADTSAFLGAFSDGFAKIIELAETILGQSEKTLKNPLQSDCGGFVILHKNTSTKD